MPARLPSVAVYCGSSPGNSPAFAAAAAALGQTLAERGTALVYGGGNVGLMGIVAHAVMDGGGQAHGVITRALQEREVADHGLTSLRVVETMHERKAVMADAAEAFIMMPGGYGTLDEFFEVLTWAQLGIHRKPCGILDVGAYFGPLQAFINSAVSAGFVHPENRDRVQVDEDPGCLLDAMAAWEPPAVDKWLNSAER